MKKKRSFFKLNNKGASLVMVIIVIGFIGILAGVVMMTSLVNYKMKRVNAYAKDTFYSAEQVLDEINVGLQRYISDSISAAYTEVMENYSDYSVEKKRTVLQTNYYERMWDKLQKNGTNQNYDVSVLEGFLKDSTLWQGDAVDGYGAIVRAIDADGVLSMTGNMSTYEDGIVLKDLRVYYKDSKGFVSIIQTDIRLTYPELDFTSTTVLPDVASYGVIADNGVVTEGNGPLALEGDFYLDSFTSEGTNPESRKAISHSGDGKVVVKHDMLLKNASFTNEETGTVWADGIETVGGTLDLSGTTLLADDLNIRGDKSVITLSGTYNGFGSSIKDSDRSSAILINGTNSSLDLSGIEKITLAGHAYVGTKNTTEDDDGEETEESTQTNTNDVFTGESIAVKSNQLMYMIPAECIGVDSTTGKSAFNKNPLTTEEYNTIKGDTDRYTEVSLDVTVRKLGSTLTDYISKINGVAQPEVVFVPTSDTPLVYYYMKFDNEEAANRYFSLYYNSNKETYDRYIESYVEFLKFPTTATVTRIKLAANGVYGDAENGYYMLPYTVQGASTQLADNQVQYQERFTALCTKLTENYTELTNLTEAPDRNSQVLFENLVNANELSAYIAAGEGGATLRLHGEKGDVILTKETSITVNDSDVHLVISTGNVKINVHNFTGTVFANGIVTTSANVQSIKADPETVNAMLRYYQEISGQNVMVAQVLQDGNDYMFAIQDEEDTQRTTTSMADLIVYENWKKE